MDGDEGFEFADARPAPVWAPRKVVSLVRLAAIAATPRAPVSQCRRVGCVRACFVHRTGGDPSPAPSSPCPVPMTQTAFRRSVADS